MDSRRARGVRLSNIVFLSTSEYALPRLPYQEKYHHLLDVFREFYMGSPYQDLLEGFLSVHALVKGILRHSRPRMSSTTFWKQLSRCGYSVQDVFSAAFNRAAITRRHKWALSRLNTWTWKCLLVFWIIGEALSAVYLRSLLCAW